VIDRQAFDEKVDQEISMTGKTMLAGVVALLAAGAVLLCVAPLGAIPVHPAATSVAEYVKKAERIIIATVEEEPKDLNMGFEQAVVTPAWTIKGAESAEKILVTVLHVRLQGPAAVSIQKGRQYMFAGTGGSKVGESTFVAVMQDIGVVEIPPDFSVETLEGLSPQEQVEAVFSARHKWVTAEVERLSNEKAALERLLPAKTPATRPAAETASNTAKIEIAPAEKSKQ